MIVLNQGVSRQDGRVGARWTLKHEGGLIEDDVMRDQQAVAGEIEAPIPLGSE
jgi:hypothetical protein